MRKALFLAVIVMVMACVSAIAADKIGTFGAPNSSGTYPMEVFDDKTIVVASDATFTVSGTSDFQATEINGSLVTDGTIYTAKIVSDGAIYVAMATVDPCATLASAGYIFTNTSGALCICKAGVAENTVDGTTNCF